MKKVYKLEGECLSPIARPLAGPELVRTIFKVIKKATEAKQIRRGVKEAIKSIRKNQKGVMVLAADVSPVDVLSHFPVLCEEMAIPYIFVPSKTALGYFSATKRPTSCLMILPSSKDSDYGKHYAKLCEALQPILHQ